MSCWVVPSVAAELWGCTVDAVLCAMRNGNVPSKEDSGWTFVDVAPDSPKLETPRSVLPPTPETYSVVSQAEMMALTGGESGDQTSETDLSDAPFEPVLAEQDDDALVLKGDWRSVRENVAQTRRAPLAKAA